MSTIVHNVHEEEREEEEEEEEEMQGEKGVDKPTASVHA